jgi:hypothetical protein
MNRKSSPLICVSFVLLCCACNSAFAQTQVCPAYRTCSVNCSINRCFNDPRCLSCCECGFRNWYNCNFGAEYPFRVCYNYHDYCCYGQRGLMGHRSRYGACCSSFAGMNRAACCSPAPNCCAAMSCGAAATYSGGATSLPASAAPLPSSNATASPTPAPINPTPPEEAPKPVL